jgi:hypothetical protein
MQTPMPIENAQTHIKKTKEAKQIHIMPKVSNKESQSMQYQKRTNVLTPNF